MKQKIKIIASAILGISLALLLGMSVQGKTEEKTYTLSQLYATSGIVVEIQETETDFELITFECQNGNLFSFYSDSGDWFIDDIVSVIMDNNGTEIVYDDIILSAQYSGYGWSFER